MIKLLIRLQFPEIQQLSTAELAAWLSFENPAKSLLILDARTSEEYRVSHLIDAKLVSPNLEDLIDFKETNYSRTIVVYCSIGYRCSKIVRRLQSLGYQNVFNLSGSIFQWVNENRPVYQKGKPVTKVHPYQKFWQHLLVESNCVSYYP